MSGLLPLTMRDLKKWYRNPISLLTGLIQPFFWIALFGSAFDITKIGFPGFNAGTSLLGGAPNYITFIVGGVLTISGLFTAMFAGVNLIFDRRLGPMARFLVSPIRRSSIVFAKIISATFRILVQVAILILAAVLLPNGLIFPAGFSMINVAIIIITVVLVSLIFTSIFSAIAIRITRMETIFGIINLVNLPLLFASYAMFPSGLMAGWLSDVARYNPVSWSSEAIRMVIINGTLSASQMSQVITWVGALALLAVSLTAITYVIAERGIGD